MQEFRIKQIIFLNKLLNESFHVVCHVCVCVCVSVLLAYCLQASAASSDLLCHCRMRSEQRRLVLRLTIETPSPRKKVN
jgi:hypothetical protein